MRKNNFIEELKSYLGTMPSNTTVGQIIDNINKATEEKAKSIEKLKNEMDKNIGKTYLFKEEDTYFHVDDGPIVTYCSYIKITGTILSSNNSIVLYQCQEYEISEDNISHSTNTTINEDDLKAAKEIDNSIYDDIESKFKEITNKY